MSVWRSEFSPCPHCGLGSGRCFPVATVWLSDGEMDLRDNMLMIISSPFVIILSADERRTLTDRAHAARAAHRDVVRATIILAAADGAPNAAIAAQLGLHLDTVRKWRRRFAGQRLAGLNDLPRPGRPRQFSPVQVAEVKALACELPATSNNPAGQVELPRSGGGGRPARHRGLGVDLDGASLVGR
jgi:transposase-like protein